MKIDAALAWGPGKPLEVTEIDLAEPASGEVLVRLVATGMCHTDMTILDKAPLPWPAVLGHEGAGVVMAVGEGVVSVAVGDHVILTTASCGTCPQCRDGEPSYCASFALLNMSGGRRADKTCTHTHNGKPVFGMVMGQSAFASHVLVPQRCAVVIDRELPLATLAPLGCGIQTGAGAVINTARPREGDSMAVFGCGAVGLSALMAAKISGCTPLIAVDKNPERLALAKELGATHIINADHEDTVKAIQQLTGEGADFVIEASGVAAVMEQAIQATGRRGTAVLVGVSYSQVSFGPTALQTGGRTIKGSMMCGDHADPQSFIPFLVREWQEGRLPFSRLVRSYPFAQINEAMADARSGAAIKPVLVMPEAG